jgi:hypothetical protein
VQICALHSIPFAFAIPGGKSKGRLFIEAVKAKEKFYPRENLNNVLL